MANSSPRWAAEMIAPTTGLGKMLGDGRLVMAVDEIFGPWSPWAPRVRHDRLCPREHISTFGAKFAGDLYDGNARVAQTGLDARRPPAGGTRAVFEYE